MCFSLSAWNCGYVVGIWRIGEGTDWLRRCRWKDAGELQGGFRVCFSYWQRCHLVELKTAGDCVIINYRERVCRCNSRCQRSHLASIPHFSSLRAITQPTTLFSDNLSTISLTKDHQYHARTKHIDIHFHFIRWIMQALWPRHSQLRPSTHVYYICYDLIVCICHPLL